ncbi:MAG: SCP2 sterol-binding domain-containing protein [Candidatus Hodarchaeota archaeon]
MTVLEEIRTKIQEGTLSGEELPKILDAIVEIVKADEDSMEMLQDMAEEGDDLWINFEIPGIGIHCLEIKGGDIAHLDNGSENPTVTITTDADTAVGVISGQLDPMKAFSQKKLKLSGELTKAAGLILILNVVGDALGVDLER